MAETILKVVKVFIGSPRGLENERQAARRIVDEINQSHSEHWGCQIKLVGWKATLPGYSRAQSLINQDLDKCQYFAGVIWNHWGSKPDDVKSKYGSGFEEEFERARDRIHKGLMKDILLFFKVIPEAQLKDMGPSVRKVVSFRNACIKRRMPLFKDFEEARDFERLFRATIEEIGWLEAQTRNTLPGEASDTGQPATSDKQNSSEQQSTDRFIGISSAKFITGLLKKPSKWDATNPFEIARFRLIAVSTTRSGNDELYLGNHDANLLFLKRNDFNFDKNENYALIDSGIAGFGHQNVPLWHWLGVRSGSADIFRRVAIEAVI